MGVHFEENAVNLSFKFYGDRRGKFMATEMADQPVSNLPT